jgi:hypothetical protein
MEARYRDGRDTTEPEVMGLVVAIIFSGKHTSSATSTWTGAQLLRHAECIEAALDEQWRVVAEHVDEAGLIGGSGGGFVPVVSDLRIGSVITIEESAPVVGGDGLLVAQLVGVVAAIEEVDRCVGLDSRTPRLQRADVSCHSRLHGIEALGGGRELDPEIRPRGYGILTGKRLLQRANRRGMERIAELLVGVDASAEEAAPVVGDHLLR